MVMAQAERKKKCPGVKKKRRRKQNEKTMLGGFQKNESEAEPRGCPTKNNLERRKWGKPKKYLKKQLNGFQKTKVSCGVHAPPFKGATKPGNPPKRVLGLKGQK